MDTVTHTLAGIGLAGLALGNPEVAHNTQHQQAIFLATMIGSQGPDLDIIYRIKGKVNYYKHHRGLSHSVPTLITMSLATSLTINLIFPQASLISLAFWTLLAATLHVGLDLLNPYGTAIFEPVKSKRFSLNILQIIDPFIIIVLTGAISIWTMSTYDSFLIFSFAFLLIGVYIAIRISTYLFLTQYLKQTLKYLYPEKINTFTLMPLLLPTKWDLVIDSKENLVTGSVSFFPLEISLGESYQKIQSKANLTSIKEVAKLPEIQAFSNQAKHLTVETEEFGEGYLIRWTDLAYCFFKSYPYTAVVIVNSQSEVVYSDFGWHQKKIPSWVNPGRYGIN